MIYQGNSITVQAVGDGIAELKFDLQGESVNKFNVPTIEDLGKAVAALKAAAKDIKGRTSPSSPPCSSCRPRKSPAGRSRPTGTSRPSRTCPSPPCAPSTASRWAAAWKWRSPQTTG
jgi:hypothetical protein